MKSKSKEKINIEMWGKKCDKLDNFASGNKLENVPNVAHHPRIAFAYAISYLTLEREFLPTLSSVRTTTTHFTTWLCGNRVLFTRSTYVCALCIHETVCE